MTGLLHPVSSNTNASSSSVWLRLRLCLLSNVVELMFLWVINCVVVNRRDTARWFSVLLECVAYPSSLAWAQQHCVERVFKVRSN